MASAADRCSLTLLQLHGDEGPAYCDEAARRTGCKVMKAVQVRDAAPLTRRCAPTTSTSTCSTPTSRSCAGGTGETFDWELDRRTAAPVPLVLSGGSRPTTSARRSPRRGRSRSTRASGTEAEPGRKDPAKLEAFFRAVEAADHERAAA